MFETKPLLLVSAFGSDMYSKDTALLNVCCHHSLRRMYRSIYYLGY